MMAVILHLLGVVIGMGAAVTTDFMFFSCLRRRAVTAADLRYIRLGSRVVWLGIIIIIISGLLLFAEHPDRYLQSGKFLAKMTIVGVIILNGLVFHFAHLKTLEQGRWTTGLFASGAVSSVSWLGALILGALGRSPYTYSQIMVVYGAVLVIALLLALLLKRQLKLV